MLVFSECFVERILPSPWMRLRLAFASRFPGMFCGVGLQNVNRMLFKGLGFLFSGEYSAWARFLIFYRPPSFVWYVTCADLLGTIVCPPGKYNELFVPIEESVSRHQRARDWWPISHITDILSLVCKGGNYWELVFKINAEQALRWQRKKWEGGCVPPETSIGLTANPKATQPLLEVFLNLPTG